jgi:transmembrane sensor
MITSRLELLFDLYVSHKCTVKEEEELMAMINLPENGAALEYLVTKLLANTGSEAEMPHHATESILHNILTKDPEPGFSSKYKSNHRFYWPAVAAATILFLSVTTLWFFETKRSSFAPVTVAAAKPPAISPAAQKALLTLGDGRKIALDSTHIVAFHQGKMNVLKGNGMLNYDVSSSTETANAIDHNTLTTPKGGRYHLVLADGTRVWLNAESSLYFPTSFPGNLREVVLTGEAYFEVAKNSKQPFQVKVGEMLVNVVGTHFNINAYSDENNIRTSLLEGSVKISARHAAKFLKPGEQGALNKKDDKLVVNDVDMDEVMAWKNGLFQFDGADIASIMRQISRWYNVEIVYPNKVPMRSFNGKISRTAALSDVLQILELSNVKFITEGNKIIVQ